MSQSRADWISPRWAIALLVYLMALACIAVAAYHNVLPVSLERIPHYDIAGHFILMGTAAYLTHRALGRRMVGFGGWRFPLGPVAIALMTMVDEWLQHFSPARTMSMIDFLANVAGITAFYGLDHWERRSSSRSRQKASQKVSD